MNVQHGTIQEIFFEKIVDASSIGHLKGKKTMGRAQAKTSVQTSVLEKNFLPKFQQDGRDPNWISSQAKITLHVMPSTQTPVQTYFLHPVPQELQSTTYMHFPSLRNAQTLHSILKSGDALSSSKCMVLLTQFF